MVLDQGERPLDERHRKRLNIHIGKMATRAVLQTFERYQKERVAFVTAVAEMAKNPQVLVHGMVEQALAAELVLSWTFVFTQNVEALQQAGTMALLRPLLLDNVPR